jgi:hypothetical protein
MFYKLLHFRHRLMCRGYANVCGNRTAYAHGTKSTKRGQEAVLHVCALATSHSRHQNLDYFCIDRRSCARYNQYA